MAIQERENDLVLATFGRGFYILHNYAPLRELTNEVLDKEAHLFNIKDGKMFKTWRPLGWLGSKEKGFQGSPKGGKSCQKGARGFPPPHSPI